MSRILRVCVLCLAASFWVVPAKADICDDINDLSNAWNEIANLLHDLEAEGVSGEDAQALDELLDLALDPTQALGKALTEVGDQEEEALGNELLQHVYELRSRRNGDYVSYLVDVIDDITWTLDAVTDYCDAG